MERPAALYRLLERTDSIAILCHDNPDPDCLASALAFEAIASTAAVNTIDIVYGGSISHQQNRAFVNLLELDIVHVTDRDVSVYDRIAYIDHSLPGETTSIPATDNPDIVIDNHPSHESEAAYTDIRPSYGATSTILVEYLLDLEIDITERLATALLFALHRERLDFIRSPTRYEYRAALSVFPYADLSLLVELYGASFTPATVDAIGQAIASRHRRGSTVVSHVGRTVETDALPQAADFLLNLEGVDTVLVSGIVDGSIRVSARSVDPRIHIGRVLSEAFRSVGTIGGHHNRAGGHIELGIFGRESVDFDELNALIENRIGHRFFGALHLDSQEE